jgi:PD-(D/E)XK endonuclease
MMTSYQVATAAEALAAAQFARLGFNVSVQYGANQPGYDLVIDNDEYTLKVSVKGSQDGSWGLTQAYLKKAGKANFRELN